MAQNMGLSLLRFLYMLHVLALSQANIRSCQYKNLLKEDTMK